MLAACGGGAPAADPDGGAGLDAATRRDAAVADGDAPTSDTGLAADDAGGRRIAICRRACAVAADCATPGTRLYDASHHTCDAGLCRWLGCRADAECAEAFGSPSWGCRDQRGLMQCVQLCASAADCGNGTATHDADNYLCSSGICDYQGCNDDAECAATFGGARYICREEPLPGVGLPLPPSLRNCVLRCDAPADCATPSPVADADNYECRAGACRHTGCNGDAECAAAFSSDRYVCR